MTPKVAIITVSYGHAKFMPALFVSLDRLTYPREALKIWLLDNQSPDETYEVVRGFLDETGTKTKAGIPCALIKSPTNRGFAGGNNDCMKLALAEGYECIFLLNPDTEIAPDALQPLVAALEPSGVGAVQPLLLLAQDRTRINSAGNAIHYLGMSWCDGYRQTLDDPAAKPLLQPREVVSLSGAGMMLRAAALKEVGLFDELLFAYHEDVELSWRLRLADWSLRLVPESRVWHAYEFSRSIKKYYWMERNRFLVLLMCYQLPTLILIAPMLLALEIGMLSFAFLRGWGREKLRVYGYFLKPSSWRAFLPGWRRNRHLRKTTDRAITAGFSTRVLYQEVDSPALRYVANPLMTLYWRLCRLLLWW